MLILHKSLFQSTLITRSQLQGTLIGPNLKSCVLLDSHKFLIFSSKKYLKIFTLIFKK